MRPPSGGTPLDIDVIYTPLKSAFNALQIAMKFGDEIRRQKTRVLDLPDGEESMPLVFFVLTQYRRVTDGQTDGHVAIAITRASIASCG